LPLLAVLACACAAGDLLRREKRSGWRAVRHPSPRRLGSQAENEGGKRKKQKGDKEGSGSKRLKRDRDGGAKERRSRRQPGGDEGQARAAKGGGGGGDAEALFGSEDENEEEPVANEADKAFIDDEGTPPLPPRSRGLCSRCAPGAAGVLCPAPGLLRLPSCATPCQAPLPPQAVHQRRPPWPLPAGAEPASEEDEDQRQQQVGAAGVHWGRLQLSHGSAAAAAPGHGGPLLRLRHQR
jgi:hypothetical protein